MRVTRPSSSALEIEVRNPLVGPPVDGTGYGLVGLAERVALLDGDLEHGVEEGADRPEFRLRARLAWEVPR